MLSSQRHKSDFVVSGLNAPASPLRAKNQSAFQFIEIATGKIWWLKEGINHIGRSFDNDMVVADESVSRHHARLSVTGGNVFIEDLNSANGVFVGRERIGKSAVFIDTVVRLGRIDLVLKRPSLAEQSGCHPW
jgi:pSer/pThr/pTyr-binding forkhead associated (FHA) protein